MHSWRYYVTVNPDENALRRLFQRNVARRIFFKYLSLDTRHEEERVKRALHGHTCAARSRDCLKINHKRDTVMRINAIEEGPRSEEDRPARRGNQEYRTDTRQRIHVYNYTPRLVDLDLDPVYAQNPLCIVFRSFIFTRCYSLLREALRNYTHDPFSARLWPPSLSLSLYFFCDFSSLLPSFNPTVFRDNL